MKENKNKNKVIVALSGGLDSTTLLAEAIAEGYDIVHAVGFYYGSKHGIYENQACASIAKYYKVPHVVIDIEESFSQIKSALLAKEKSKIPEGHYEADTMKQTVVPGRNMIFASILAGMAESMSAGTVMLGIHAGDHHIYPDCRPEFAIAMAGAVMAATEGQVELHAPFLRYKKVDILKRGLDLKVPYELTRTCYKKQRTACGKCGSCQERLEAFSLLGQKDPLEYESRELLPKQA